MKKSVQENNEVCEYLKNHIEGKTVYYDEKIKIQN